MNDDENELIAEANATLHFRLNFNKHIENYKWLGEWTPKRLDVMAINSAFIVSIIIMFVLEVCLLISYKFHVFQNIIYRKCFLDNYLIIYDIIILLILAILWFSNHYLSKQVKYIFRGVMEKKNINYY